MSQITLLVTACLFAPWAEDQAVRLHITTINGQSLDVELVEITRTGVVRYRRDDGPGELALEDVLRFATPHESAREDESVVEGARTIHLADGGVFRGDLMPVRQARRRTLRVEISEDIAVSVPFEAVAAVRTAPTEAAEMEHEFRQRLAARRSGRDVMIIAKDGKPVVVPGSLERLTPEGWEFRFGSRTRSAGLDEVYGFILGAPPVAPKRLPATVLMNNGNRFTARVLWADGSGIEMDGGLLGRLRMPWRSIRRLDLRSRRIVYVSDLSPIRTRQRSMLGLSWPPQRDKNVTRGPIRLANRTYAKGLGVHAYTALSYKLDGEYERFSAVVGVDDAVAPDGCVVFRVRADGEVLKESDTLRGGDAPEALSVDVLGVKVLTLECDLAEDLDLSDHADWANAILIRAKGEDKS